ncbi:Glyoxylase, beta-lactamase superfamily II [Alicyclobacillus hesperidum]|uniref:Glyoxylase, beta-lactamase superfamily II n=1 Tax=Alicyclobacillus hesperidum TaxID=89784 RepID=A0A1H2R6T4_9BACL|nr:MBL fold metallo-hydrolase [Alicyclobacillus hesperidum]SDW15176.1 Glyoxylase, beta-lactamase superfamily II [Alicyclobacillus hesperidum]
MEVRCFFISPLRSCCYVIAESFEQGAQAVVIDPGDLHLDPVFEFIDGTGLQIVANWNTHAHFDHIIGVDLLRDRYGILAWVHEADAPVWAKAHVAHEQFLGTPAPPVAKPDQYMHDGDTLTLGDETFTVWHTPGHSPGSVCLVGKQIVFSGDTLFAGTIGRTDLEGSSPEDMQQSLARILDWRDDLMIYPGHGVPTSMAVERRNNRFLREIASRLS